MSDTQSATRPFDPVADADAAARAEARALLAGAGHAALSWIDAADGLPGISRIAFGFDPEEGPLTLVSGLAAHAPALRANPACALMVGEAGPKGDPMNHPRLMLRARAEFIARDAAGLPGLRARWLARNPKAKVYIDLPDFSFVRLAPVSAVLNGGFARAFRLTAEDLAP
ncbi:HugZ family protein [Pseudogemmobacter sonorensis]|uniref:HugZ family pyridoxamine 5'-phosphate oxidase n=1 Tax=Pseudogemmobacter sonorensis TaxID=2989681 RepID=UPI0036753434